MASRLGPALRPLVCALALVIVAWVPRPAAAWVETAVRAHSARVTVDAAGRAEVRHELHLKVRGGPVDAIEVPGIGDAVEPLPDAMVRRAQSGGGSVWPLEQAVTEDGALRLRVVSERGLSGGNFIFEFAYSVDLAARGWVEARGAGTRVTWVGPRLASGVDSASVVFVVPSAPRAPELAAPESGRSAGVLLTEVRRGAGADEIELVRAHVARGEPAVWQVLVDAESVRPPGRVGPAAPAGVPVVARALGAEPSALRAAGLAVLFALVFGALLFAKARAVARAAAVRDTRPRPLLPGSALLRALLGALGAGAGTFWVMEHRPIPAALAAALALAAGAYLLPVRQLRPRGPGVWRPARETAALAAPAPGPDWFELGTLRGFGSFVGLLVLDAALALHLLPTDNALALLSTLPAVVLLPLYFTGRRADLPRPPAEQAREVQALLARALPSAEVGVELWVRTLELTSEVKPGAVDEARVRLIPRAAPQGLRALEVAFDEAAGPHLLPCVVVRVIDDSAAMRRLPAELVWQRGRSVEERVAILRPTLPTRAQLLRLLRGVLARLAQREGGDSQNAARSGGSGDSARKGVPSGAVPAMRLACSAWRGESPGSAVP